MKHDLKHEGIMIDMTKLQTEVATLKEQDLSGMCEDDLRAYQRAISSMNKALTEAMAKTSQKEHSYDMEALQEHVQHILSECWEGRAVQLSDNDKFVEAQKLRRFAPLIALCVKRSNFKEGFVRQFPMLSVQRNAIDSAKTLQELRSACKAMIGPLKLSREHKEYKDSYLALYGNTVTNEEYDDLLRKLEDTEEMLAETKRVNAEILGLFEPAQKLEGKELLDAIEEFKQEQSCTDAEACKPFNVSRTTLFRLRKEFK